MNAELDLIRPIRAAVRSLARSKTYALVALLSVGGTIGLAATVYAVVSATYFAPLAGRAPDELVQFWQTASPSSTHPQDYLQPRRMETWVRDAEFRTMSAVAATGMGPTLVVRSERGGERVTAAPVLGDFFGLMGVAAARGRVLGVDDLRPGAPAAVVVSDAFWRKDLGGGGLGEVVLSGVPFTVVGVMPRSFEPARRVWMSVEALPEGVRPAAYRGLGRLRAGNTADAAAVEVQSRAANQVAADSAGFGGLGATTRSIAEARSAQERPQLWMLAGVVAAVLLVALNNLGVLTLVRADARSVDLAVRASLGASRYELARALALEGVLVGAAGAALGLLVAGHGVKMAAGLVGAADAPPPIGPDTVAVAIGFGGVISCALALIPLGEVPGTELRACLQRRAGGVGGTPSERRTRMALVGAQVAVAVVLISVALVVRSAYGALSRLDVGYDPTRIVEARPDWEVAGVPGADQWSIARRTLDRIGRAPGVGASAAWQEVGQVYPPRPEIEAVTDGPTVELGMFDGLYRYYEITPSFFETLGTELERGRGFGETPVGGAPVAIVSSRGADVWWPGQNPLGRQVKLGQDGTWMTIVGVAPDFRQLNMLGRASSSLPNPVMPLLFVPAGQFDRPPPGWATNSFWGGVRIGARADDRLGEATRAVREAVASISPDLPLVSLGPLHEQQMEIGDSVATTGRLVELALAVVLGLALIGITGVVAESTTRRTREVGLRVALGAGRAGVTWTVARESLVTTTCGVFCGVLLLVLIHGWFESTVFDYMVTRLGPDLLGLPVLSLGVGVILAAASVAILLASRRAFRVDPVEALRAE